MKIHYHTQFQYFERLYTMHLQLAKISCYITAEGLHLRTYMHSTTYVHALYYVQRTIIFHYSGVSLGGVHRQQRFMVAVVTDCWTKTTLLHL